MKFSEKLSNRMRGERRSVDFGDFRRFDPFCPNWGFNRGTPIGRYYVEKFLRQHAEQMKGVFLEFGSAKYRDLFNRDFIERYEVIDLARQSADTTIIADIQKADIIPDDTFDCIVCTAVLEHVPDPFAAIREMKRIMKQGGWLLLTVPHINKIHRVPGDYWRFTEDSLNALLKDFGSFEIQSHGNALTTIAFTYGLAAEELTSEELDYVDKTFPVIYTCWAIK